MNKILPVFGVAIVAALIAFALCPFFYYPVHDIIGRQNTVYSAFFTNDRWAQVAVGTPREKVINLLGAPFQNYTLDTKRSADYESIVVYIGPDETVMWRARGVTD